LKISEVSKGPRQTGTNFRTKEIEDEYDTFQQDWTRDASDAREQRGHPDDYQGFQFAGVNSHDPQTIINNVVGLAKVARLYKVPTLLTTVTEERGGYILKQLQDVFPDQKPINRTFINAWEDKRIVDWVAKTGRKRLVMAALWTEICLAFPVIHALGDGHEVYFVSDASGGVTREAHEMGIQRMIQAGAVPLTWGVLSAEWQRDWARETTVPGLGQIVVEHYGATGTSFLWEQQLLNQGGSNRP